MGHIKVLNCAPSSPFNRVSISADNSSPQTACTWGKLK